MTAGLGSAKSAITAGRRAPYQHGVGVLPPTHRDKFDSYCAQPRTRVWVELRTGY